MANITSIYIYMLFSVRNYKTFWIYKAPLSGTQTTHMWSYVNKKTYTHAVELNPNHRSP